MNMLRNIFNPYICIKQHDMRDCGASCLASIAKYHGLSYPISKIREVAGTDNRGTNAYGLIKAAEQLGFTVKGVKGTPKDLHSKLPLPAIAHVIIEQKLLHYVIIYEITQESIIIADPGKGKITKCSLEEFFKIWTGVLVILAPNVQFIQGNEVKGIFTQFFSLVLCHKALLVNIFFVSLIYTVLGILSSFYFKFLLDDIVPNNLVKTLHIISIGMISLYVFRTLLSAFRAISAHLVWDFSASSLGKNHFANLACKVVFYTLDDFLITV